MKKIVHIISLNGIGGVQKNFINYYNLIATNEKLNHLIFTIGKIDKKYLTNEKYYSVNNIFSFIYFLYLLRSNDFIKHFYNNFGSFKNYILFKFFKTKNIIIHERGTAWNINEKYTYRYNYIFKKSSLILVNSYATKYLLINKFKLEDINNKFKVIHNGFSINPNYNYEYKKINKFFTIGFIGRLETPKGIHILLEAAKILKENENIKFMIAGDGSLKKFLQNYAKELKNIVFLGEIENIQSFFNTIDLLVVPSIREPFGNIILESGMFKVPVIASCIDGIPEIIENNVDGILIEPNKDLNYDVFLDNIIPPPQYVYSPTKNKLVKPLEIDPNLLAKSILKLFADEDLRKLYANNLFLKINNSFNMKLYIDKLNNIYSKFF